MQSGAKTTSAFEFGLLLLMAALWGLPYALTKLSLQTIPPITLTAARVLLAAAALWGVAVLMRCEIPRVSWNLTGRLFLQGVVACVVPYTLIAWGQQSVDSGLAAILNSTTPLFVCLLSLLWGRHEQMTVGRVLGVILGLGGVIVIVGADALSGLGRHSIGQLEILLATCSSALSVMYGRRFTGIAPEVVAAGMLTGAALPLVLLAAMVESPWHAAPSAVSMAALAANALLVTAPGFVLYFRLIRTIGSIGTASASYIKPAVGVLIGCVVMGEPFSLYVGIGLIAVLVGVALINETAPIRSTWHRVRSVALTSRGRVSAGVDTASRA